MERHSIRRESRPRLSKPGKARPPPRNYLAGRTHLLQSLRAQLTCESLYLHLDRLILSEILNRECHLKPDLLLIYRKPDTEVLQLVRLGLHSELFG